jgi:hypothetical protein
MTADAPEDHALDDTTAGQDATIVPFPRHRLLLLDDCIHAP